MALLPANYRWLYDISGPLALKQAVSLYGTVEIPGKKSNPTIMTWAEELGLTKAYSNDDIPWCGLFVGVCVKRANFDPVHDPLWARNWHNFGTFENVAMLGDILVFPRGSGGHVAFYVGEDKTHYAMIGGNQSNRVNIMWRAKQPIIGIRRCNWRIKQPVDVKRVFLNRNGAPVGGSEE